MFVTGRAYQRLKDDYDTDKWWWTKRVKALEERIAEGEKYREELERKNEALMQDNALLYQKKEAASLSLADAEREVKDLRMKIMSLEARWPVKEETG